MDVNDFAILRRGKFANVAITAHAVQQSADFGFTLSDINAFLNDLLDYANNSLPDFRAGVYGRDRKFDALRKLGYHVTFYSVAQKNAPGTKRMRRGRTGQRAFIVEIQIGSTKILALDLLIEKCAFESESDVNAFILTWIDGLIAAGWLPAGIEDVA